MDKPKVKYIISEHDVIQVGKWAVIQPIDHPSERVSNATLAFTSEVLSYDKDKHEFETKNTVYVGVDSVG